MHTYPKFLVAIAGIFLSLVAVEVKSADAGTFTFTKIAEADNRNFLDVGGGPINDNGTVAFAAITPSGKSIFTSNGGAIRTVVSFKSRSGFYGIAINDSGTVAFGNFYNELQEGYFISNGETVKTVAIPSNRSFSLTLENNAFNNNNTLVFSLIRGINRYEIVTTSGGSLTTVVDTSGQFRFFNQPPAINDNNVVAFTASLNDGRVGVFTIQNGLITTIADNTNLFDGGFSETSINNINNVIFEARLDSGEGGIFIGNGETITTVANTSSSFSSFSRPAINDKNQVAFNATLRNGAENVSVDGIFTGSDPIGDKVIGIGDSLLNGTVTNLFFDGGLNNFGQISFFATIRDSNNNTRNVVFRADPVSTSVPESTSKLGLLALGALGTGIILKSNLKQKITTK
ncbi:choice-of-anchor tandem repeat NxxGxxAF-containing protein [uncultured Nostoc sp.]|uniref:DUF7453 family protein n=1 Tax=uncultured Nostoc sp. TaxID=340711 RepID=UPI0035CBF40F